MFNSASKIAGLMIGSFTALVSGFSFVAAFGPFSGAAVFHVVTVPLALVALWMGAWRTAMVSLYWSACAGASLFFYQTLSISLILLAGIASGLVLGIALVADLLVRQLNRPPEVGR